MKQKTVKVLLTAMMAGVILSSAGFAAPDDSGRSPEAGSAGTLKGQEVEREGTLKEQEVGSAEKLKELEVGGAGTLKGQESGDVGMLKKLKSGGAETLKEQESGDAGTLQKLEPGNGTPPETPDGKGGEPPEMSDGGNGAPPEKPDGEDGEPPEIPGGGNGTPPEKPDGEGGEPPKMPDGGPGDSGSSEGKIALAGVFTVDGEEIASENETYESSQSDQSAVLVKNGGKLSMTGASLIKSGDTSDVDESNFYGLNAGVTVGKGSSAVISDTVIETSSEGSNAVFAAGEDAFAEVNNVTIHTAGNSSRGLDATYGGTVVGNQVDITTEGAHCAPVATDRGEGTITVAGGTLSALGDGSPCIYSTGTITVTDVTGTAAESQTLVVEGKNSITLDRCDLTGAGNNGLMLYQSTSGDAGEGTASLTVSDSVLSTTSDGPMIYVTNTDAEAVFTNTELNFESGILAQVSGNNTNNWGKEGENGGDFRLMGASQDFAGDITCDEISTFEMTLTDNSTFEGAVDKENTGWFTSVSLDESSVWTLTGDSHVTVFTNESVDNSNLVTNGYTIYYDASREENQWLGGAEIFLKDGGKLSPEE